jgi:MFS family permease
MTGVAEQQQATARISEPTVHVIMGLDYLLANFGRFSLTPVLAIMLVRQSGGADWAAGVGMFGFMVFAGLSSLLVNRWLTRFPYAATLPASMVCSAVGFGLLPYARSPAAVMAPLFFAGFGISVHAVLARVLVAEAIASGTRRNNVYSIQQIATNLAAALGPFIAGALYVAGDARPLLVFVAAAYLLAGLALLIGLPRGLYPPDAVRERSSGVAAGLRLLRDRECFRASVITVLGSFAYGQFYSAFALLVALAIDSVLLRSALLAGPPVAIALLQVVVTALANRFMRAGVAPLSILALAVLAFSVAMSLLGFGLPVVVGSIVAMSVWAVAEMLFTPLVSTTFSQITTVSRLAASNLQAVAWTVGESLGSLSGGALFLVCYQHRSGNWYWLVLAVLTFAGAAPYLARHRTTARRATT